MTPNRAVFWATIALFISFVRAAYAPFTVDLGNPKAYIDLRAGDSAIVDFVFDPLEVHGPALDISVTDARMLRVTHTTLDLTNAYAQGGSAAVDKLRADRPDQFSDVRVYLTHASLRLVPASKSARHVWIIIESDHAGVDLGSVTAGVADRPPSTVLRLLEVFVSLLPPPLRFTTINFAESNDKSLERGAIYGALCYGAVWSALFALAWLWAGAAMLCVRAASVSRLAIWIVIPLWPLGLHRLILRKPCWSNFLFVITAGGLGLWALADIFALPWAVQRTAVFSYTPIGENSTYSSYFDSEESEAPAPAPAPAPTSHRSKTKSKSSGRHSRRHH